MTSGAHWRKIAAKKLRRNRRRARAIEVTVETDAAQRALWDVQEDDYGDPMITHLHAGGPVTAYIISRWAGGTVAQCSECMAYLELAGTATALRAVTG